MNQNEVLEFDGFRVERESFLGGDCYGLVTSCKKDEEGVSYHLEVEFDISQAKFQFSKCYSHQVVPCNELSAGGRLKVMVYLVEKAAGAFVREKGISQKLSLEKLKGLYQEDDVVMGEILASEKADGLTIIIRKTKCSRIFKRSASFSKTKRNFSKLSPYPKNLKKSTGFAGILYI